MTHRCHPFVNRIFYPRISITLGVVSFQSLVVILAVLLLFVTLLSVVNKGRNVNRRTDGSENEYYQNVMRTLSERSWITTVKMLSHFFIPFYKSEWPEITVDKLYDRLNSDKPPLLIDIRSPEEYNGTDEDTKYGHIPNALSISVLDLESKLEDLQLYKEKEIVTMCPGGGLSLVAVDILNEAGFKDVKSLKGGTDLWHKKGYPTTTT